ncbi:distal tail protein Dit, partial [Pseudogracilibacillus auburnensis]|uniref:distal tail protein Dit n=1 Tax=Pseudogracilibacillus auburnensis TaxID=1494959 RepID=UPI001A97433D
MRKSMTFNGQKKPWLHLLEGRQKSPFAPIRNNLIRVNGKAGAYVSGKETDVLYITQPIGFVVDNDEHALQLKDELAAWLVTNEAVPLEFDDEPGRTYYAEIEGAIEDFNKFVDQRRGVITFLCADPYSYGPEKNLLFPADTVSLDNNGTAEIEPVFTFNVLEDTTFAMVSNGEEYMMVGRPADALETPKNTRPLILNDPASTLVGWSNFTGGFDFYGLGLVGGSMRVIGGYAFTPDTFGTNPNGWTGPAIRKSLSEPLQDFEAEIDLAMLNRSTGVGRTVIVGLDASDKPVFSMDMTDATNGYPNNRSTFRLGKDLKTWFSYQGDKNQR